MITINGRHIIDRLTQSGGKKIWLFCNKRGFGTTIVDTGERFIFCPFCGDRIGVLEKEKK